MHTSVWRTLLFVAVLMVTIPSFTGCGGEKMQSVKISELSLEAISNEKWSELSKKKIYFGHQSVGFNIIDGIDAVVKQNLQINLKIIKADGSIEGNDSFFAHSQVGKNRDPLSKLKDFSQTIKNGMGDKSDIAFLKFCYVDITRKTDIESLFESYKKELSVLEDAYPNTMFIHVTSPLKTIQTGFKAMIKRIIGRPAGGYENNIMRNKYNELILNEYAETGHVFDLALFEATRPDGSLETFSYGGENYYSLFPGYTNDGGHLNKKGQEMAAIQLLLLLANIE